MSYPFLLCQLTAAVSFGINSSPVDCELATFSHTVDSTVCYRQFQGRRDYLAM